MIKQTIKTILALLVLLISSTGAWAGLPLKSNLGANATVTFYDYGTTEPTTSFTKPSTAITQIDNSDGNDHYVIVHIVPNDGFWTDQKLLFAMETGATLAPRHAPGLNLGQSLKFLKADEYDATGYGGMKDRYDGAGWYYYKLSKEHTTTAGYTSSTVDGYVVPQFDLSTGVLSSTEASTSATTLTVNTTDGWQAVITIDKTSYPYNGELQNSAFTHNIVVKKDGTTALEISKTRHGKHIEYSIMTEPIPVKGVIDAGDYTAQISALKHSFFKGEKGGVPFKITPKELTASVTAQSKTYDGTTDATVTGTVDTGITFYNVETLTISGLTGTFDDANAGTGKTVTIDASAVSVVAGANTKTSNYNITYPTTAKGNITQKEIVSPDDSNDPNYGAITVNVPTEGYTYDGTEKKPTVTVKDGSVVLTLDKDYTLSYTSNKDAGDNTAVVIITGKGNYTIDETRHFSIAQKAVTITAQDKAFTYTGAAQSWPYYDVDGLVGSDAISAVVTGSITYPSESPVANVVSSYTFTTGTPGNYSVTTQNGTLTMTNASAAITITAASQEWTYDGNEHTNTAVTVTSGTLFEGDNLVATATGSVKDVSDTNTGNNPIAAGYKVMHGSNDVTANYVITTVAGTLTVNQKAVTITAKVTQKTYDGKTDAEVSVTVDTHVKGESMEISGLTGMFDDANAGTDKTVTVNSSNAVVKVGENTKLDNYEVVYPAQVKGTITKAALTITADDKERKKGEENPELTVTYTGFVNDENESVLTTPPTIKTTATTESPEGTYPITASDAEAENYAITYKDGTLTVLPEDMTFDVDECGIRVILNDTKEEIQNTVTLTYMNDKTSLRIDALRTITPPDATPENPVYMTLIIPATLMDKNMKPLPVYGVNSDIFTNGNIVVTDVWLPETTEMIKVADHAFRQAAHEDVRVRVHTPLALLDDYALTPGLKDEYEAGNVMAAVEPVTNLWTLSSSVDILVPEGLTALICEAVSDTEVAATAITSTKVTIDEKERTIVKANNGVMMSGTPGNYNLIAWPSADRPSGSELSTEDAQSYPGNQLVPSIVATHFPANDYYILYNNTFHELKSDDTTSVPACKAVLRKTSALMAPSLSISIDGNTTSLSEELRVKSEEFAPATGWYTVNGVKLDNKPTAKGMYIHNGRKVVVK